MTTSIYTLCTKFDITAETFESMFTVFTADNGNDLYHAMSDADRALYWRMYDALEQYNDVINPPAIVAQPKRSRRARKTA